MNPSSGRAAGDEMARILIVDDDVDSALWLLKLLQEAGHEETRITHSAADALAVATELAPRLIFLDIELPDMSGYDVARVLHQHPGLQQTRLIALTDSGEHEGRELARASGFERYLVKPVTGAAVQEVLDLFLQ
jgi:CheY-like chemotaxis protein